MLNILAAIALAVGMTTAMGDKTVEGTNGYSYENDCEVNLDCSYYITGPEDFEIGAESSPEWDAMVAEAKAQRLMRDAVLADDNCDVQ